MAFSVSYYEMHGYPRGGWQNGEFDAERRVRVAWSDRATFLSELDTYPNNTYPYGDGPASALARRVKIRPFGKSDAAGGSSLASYEECIIQIWHSTRGPQWDTTLGAFVDEKIYPAYQYGMVSRKNLRWKTDNKQLHPNDEPRLDDTLYEYTIGFFRLLVLPSWVLIRPGVCNSNAFSCRILKVGGSTPLTFAPRTLKYGGCTISSRWSLGKLQRYDVIAKYTFKGSEWNKFWRPDGGSGEGGWEELVTKDGNDYIQHQPIAF